MVQFGAGLFALAALAGVIPILIHLIHKKRAPQILFSTLRFLRISAEKTARRKRVQDLLLLVLRVAALVLLAVALTQPVLKETAGFFGGRRSLAVVFILDNSTSMGMSHSGTTRLDMAKAIIGRLLADLQEGDKAALLLTNGPSGGPEDQLVLKLEHLRLVLDKVGVSAGKADLAAAFDRAYAVLAKDPTANAEIYCLTDMQAISWEGLADQLKQESEERLRIPVLLVDVGRRDFENAALVDCRTLSPGQVIGLPVSFSARLHNQSERPIERHVDLYVDGRKEHTSPLIRLGPGETAPVPMFTYVFGKPGSHHVRLQITETDSLALDDQAFFAVNVAPKIDVCLVKPEVHAVPYLDEGFFLNRALQVLGAIEVAQITVDQLSAEDLTRYAVVFCTNLGNLQDNQARALGRYLARGGKLVWFMGDRVTAQALNEVAATPEAELLPGRLLVSLGNAEQRRESWPIAWMDESYPALKGLTDPPSVYQSVQVYQYFKMEVGPEGTARVLARLKGDDPFLVERAEGDGRTLAFCTSARRDWSNFPVRNLFAPLLNQLVFHLAEKTGAAYNFTAGAKAVFPFPDTRQPVSLQITFASEEGGSRTVQVTSVPTPESNAATFTLTDRPGVYAAKVVDGAPRSEFCFAVNRDMEESASETVAFEALRPTLPLKSLLYATSEEELGENIRRLRLGSELWNLFLLAVLAVLVGEVYVANRLRPHGKLQPEETATQRATAAAALEHLAALQEMEERRRRA